MMTNRSIHMPTLTIRATIIIFHGVVRQLRSQNNCGASTLQRIMTP